MAAPQPKYIRNPDGSISEVKEPKASSASPLSSIAPGYMVSEAVRSGMGGSAPSILGQPVATAVDGSGVLVADGVGGAVPAASPGLFSLSGFGGAGNALLPAAGLAGAYKTFTANPENVGTGKGYAQGVLGGAASGAAMGSYFGPVGMAVGGGVGATAGLLQNAFGIGGESRTKGEQKAREQLAKQGINVENSGVKEWELNEKFKASRNEADLTGKDIINAAQLWQLPGYATATPEKRQAIADEAIKQQVVRERLGQIEINPNDAFNKFATEQLAAPAASTGGGDNRRQVAEAKKERKRAQVDQVLSMNAQPTQGPRYDMNLSNIYKNPYL
jgi:hypothetical protein